MSVELRLEGVSKTFAPPVQVVDGVTLKVSAGEYLALVGPSGCGKTTLLRMIAGLEAPTAGRIVINGDCINNVSCHQRGVAMFFQKPALIPEQTVRHHLRWPATLGKPWRLFVGADGDPPERIARILGLEPDLDRPVQQLSGGQQQRVALGRCLLQQAPLCLLDEPLGHLDAPLRTDLRRQIRALTRELGVTVIHVTHDPNEAFSVGDRIAVMHRGQIVQNDTPSAVRAAPANRYVAELVYHETGGMNAVAGDIRRDGLDTFFESPLGRWPMSGRTVELLRESLGADAVVLPSPLRGRGVGGEGEIFPPEERKVHIIMAIAVEDVRCTTAPSADVDEVRFAVRVDDVESGAAVIGTANQVRWVGRGKRDERFERGQVVTMAFWMDKSYWFDAKTGRTLALPTG